MSDALGLGARARRLAGGPMDRLLAVVAAGGVVTETVIEEGLTPMTAADAAVALVVGAGVWHRRRAPIPAGLAVVGAGVLVDSLVLLPWLLLACYSIGAHLPRRRAAAGASLAIAITCATEVPEARSFASWLDNVIFIVLVMGGMGLAGIAVRTSRRRAAQLAALAAELEREREENARLAVAAERSRIARELHDVVSHSISLIAVQSGAARLTVSGEPQSRAALQGIETTARHALTEMRRMLGLLRESREPAEVAPLPGLSEHGELIEQARAAGLDVRLDTAGEARRLPAGVDLAAYRVLQEALTNVRKHAPGSRVDVSVRYGADDVEIEVLSAGASAAHASTNGDGGGYGLIGMRERAGLYGGELDAGPLPNGGFRVRARLPVDEARA